MRGGNSASERDVMIMLRHRLSEQPTGSANNRKWAVVLSGSFSLRLRGDNSGTRCRPAYRSASGSTEGSADDEGDQRSEIRPKPLAPTNQPTKATRSDRKRVTRGQDARSGTAHQHHDCQRDCGPGNSAPAWYGTVQPVVRIVVNGRQRVDELPDERRTHEAGKPTADHRCSERHTPKWTARWGLLEDLHLRPDLDGN